MIVVAVTTFTIHNGKVENGIPLFKNKFDRWMFELNHTQYPIANLTTLDVFSENRVHKLRFIKDFHSLKLEKAYKTETLDGVLVKIQGTSVRHASKLRTVVHKGRFIQDRNWTGVDRLICVKFDKNDAVLILEIDGKFFYASAKNPHVIVEVDKESHHGNLKSSGYSASRIHSMCEERA